MDLKRTWFTMGVFLLISLVIWIGFSIYFNISKSDINPNAASYVKNIRPVFDEKTLDLINEKLDKLPISPDTFVNLVNKN